MIKNQLYPYIEKYINEYLYGFSKEQLNIGVMKGTIDLNNLMIRPDKVNEKFDMYDVPIWIKAGIFNKINISMSLMNFISEKPLEVNINDIDVVFTISYKWLLRNIHSYIMETEEHYREAYDPLDNNSHNIFTRNINICDASILRKKAIIFEIFKDKTKLSQILNTLFTKMLKFYYQKAYLILLKVKNINIRIEDDQLNLFGNTAFGVRIGNLELELLAEGIMKKDSFKIENVDVYWEPNPKLLIPSQLFVSKLNNDNQIDDSYYEFLKTINFKKSENNYKIISNFCCMGKFGIQVLDNNNIDFFSRNRQKNYKFYLQMGTNEINVSFNPDFINKISNLIDFFRSYYILEELQEFKPMRKPYVMAQELENKLKKDKAFNYKRKLIARDWLYYMVWFNRLKKAIYGKVFKNEINEEFSKYFNIACLKYVPRNEINDANIESRTHNESEINKIDPSNPLEKSMTSRTLNTQHVHQPTKIEKPEDLNPENINLSANIDILVKSIKIEINQKNLNNDSIKVEIPGTEFKLNLNKTFAEIIFNFSNLSVFNKLQPEIDTITMNSLYKEAGLSSSSDHKNKPVIMKKDVQQLNFNFNNETHISEVSLNETMRTLNKANSKKLMMLNEILDDPSCKKSKFITANSPFKSDNIVNLLFKDEMLFHNNNINELSVSNGSLSQKLNQLNKMSKYKKSQKPSITVNSVNDKPISTKIKFIEISNEDRKISFRFKKENLNNGLIQNNIEFDLGNINILTTESIIQGILEVVIQYKSHLVKMFEKLSQLSKKTLDIKTMKLLYQLKYIIFKKIIEDDQLQSNPNITQYQIYLKEQLGSTGYSLDKNKNFEIELLFSKIFNLNLDINAKYSSATLLMIAKDSLLNKFKPASKIKLPRLDLKLSLSNESITLYAFGIETFNQIDHLYSLSNQILNIFKNEINLVKTSIYPIISIIIKNESNFENKDTKKNTPKNGRSFTEIIKQNFNQNQYKSQENVNFFENDSEIIETEQAFDEINGNRKEREEDEKFFENYDDDDSLDKVDSFLDNKSFNNKLNNKVGEIQNFQIRKDPNTII